MLGVRKPAGQLDSRLPSHFHVITERPRSISRAINACGGAWTDIATKAEKGEERRFACRLACHGAHTPLVECS